jgi:hypothetical protein
MQVDLGMHNTHMCHCLGWTILAGIEATESSSCN